MADSPGKRARVAVALGALQGVVRAGEDLLGRAQRLAPVQEGTLRASGTLTISVNGARFEGAGAAAAARAAVIAAARASGPIKIDAEVAFTEVYAARQHEELGWRHPKGGQAKYLEQPLLENADRYQRAIALSSTI